MIEFKILLLYYLSSIPTFAAVGALWASALKSKGENIEIKHGVVSLLVLQLAIFVTFGAGSQFFGLLFKWLGL